MIKEAFFNICQDSKPAISSYISLYKNVPFYGGPEEGGWWGSDTVLVAYHQCSNEVEAEAVKLKVEEYAHELSNKARKDFGQACLAQCEWLEARGLDSDYLPEVDGEINYFVAVEETPGENASKGCRHYE
jgi:hypothetical protein